jgi:hypothetical protein
MNDLSVKKITLKEAQAICRHIKKPANSFKSAGKLYNIDPSQIKAILAEHGLSASPGRPGQSIVSDADLKYALKRLKAGLTRDSVRMELGVHINTLKRSFKLKGIKIPPKTPGYNLSQQQIDQITKLYTNGLTTTKISIKLQISVHTVQYYYLKVFPKPIVNFKPTSPMFDQLVRLLKADIDIPSIAEAFETTEYFIRLMIISKGIPGYFKQQFKYPPQHGLNTQSIRKLIKLKYIGVPSDIIALELNTTRPTIDKLLIAIEDYFYKNIMGGQYGNDSL